MRERDAGKDEGRSGGQKSHTRNRISAPTQVLALAVLLLGGDSSTFLFVSLQAQRNVVFRFLYDD